MRTVAVSDPGDVRAEAAARLPAGSSTSPIPGRFSMMTGPDTSSEAAITGSASFLLPAGRISPWMGRPPSTVN